MTNTRRWTIFVLTGLTTFVTGVFVARTAPDLATARYECGPRLVAVLPEPSAWQVLLSFENEDLERLDQEAAQTLRKAIDTLRGKVDDPGSFPMFEPARFQLISNTAGEQRYVLVEKAQIRFIPGSSELRIHVFDASGALLDTQEISMWRTFLKQIRFRKLAALKHEVLMVDTNYVLGGSDDTKFYLLIGSKLRELSHEGKGRFKAIASNGE
jgi:hypothetical protein